MRRRRTWTLSVGAACLSSIAAATRPVERTIAHLDAADPAVRNAAAESLSLAGDAIRPAVIAALPGASPEAADRLATLLLRTVHWDAALRSGPDPDNGPSPAYDALPPDDRAARVASLRGATATVALTQVLTADPDPGVRWAAVDGLRAAFEPASAATDDGPAPEAALTVARSAAAKVVALVDLPPDPSTYPVPAENGALLAAAAWAAQPTDPVRADALLARALAIESAHPSAFRGQAANTFKWAADRATDRGDFAAAADLCRSWAARTPWADDDLPEPVTELFALHAERGPFPGFADDLRLYRPHLTHAELLYCLARVADRQGGLVGGGASAALTAAAMAASGTSVEAHCDVGRFLFAHGWSTAARRELEGCLWLPGADSSADLCLALHALANDCDDDAAAGRYLEAALRKSTAGGMVRVGRYGDTVPWTEADQWAEVHWHYLRVAVTDGDRPGALAQARQLLDLDASGQVLSHDPGMAADIVPVLSDAGRLDEADRCFTAAYAALGRDVAKRPAEPMPKNNLAWLCARSGRHLDEAEKLSADAVRLAPADAACLDTRAEVLFRSGQAKEAIALESRALAAKPDDVYMHRQLARFRAAGR